MPPFHLSRYQYINSINIVSVHRHCLDKDNLSPIAKTVIELDADIVTILPKEFHGFGDQTDTHLLLGIHSSNILLANHLFLYPLTRIIKLLKWLTGIARTVFTLLSLVPGLWGLWATLFLGKEPNFSYILPILGFFGIPPMVYKIVPKILGYFLKKKLKLES